jgi:glycosyltransferase involved in cell wall biosynthesis
MKSIHVITSAFNEEVCIPELYRQLVDVFELEAEYYWKLLIIDNGSSDNTWKIISNISNSDNRVQGVRMSRNFSLDAAFTCGVDLVDSDAAIIMCSDLQDPPHVISQFLREFESGYDQVVAKVIRRDSVPLIRRMLSSLFYKFANALTDNQIPQGVSDFRLVSKACYLAMRRMREQHRFVRGLFAWTGFKTKEIPIDRPPRFGGQSHFLGTHIFRVLSWSVQSIISNTTKPLIWISFFGFVSSFLSILLVLAFSLLWFIVGVPFAGFGTIVGLVSLGFSLMFLFTGVIAQYLALIFEQVKERPLYLISEKTQEL